MHYSVSVMYLCAGSEKRLKQTTSSYSRPKKCRASNGLKILGFVVPEMPNAFNSSESLSFVRILVSCKGLRIAELERWYDVMSGIYVFFCAELIRSKMKISWDRLLWTR